MWTLRGGVRAGAACRRLDGCGDDNTNAAPFCQSMNNGTMYNNV